MLPFMRSNNTRKKYSITAFGGVNPSYSRAVNELKDGVNLSSSKYPALTSAKGYLSNLFTTRSIVSAGFYNTLYTIQEATSLGNVYLSDGKNSTVIGPYFQGDTVRGMEFMKDNILIIPDNVIYNTEDKSVKKCSISYSCSEDSAREKFFSESPNSASMPLPYSLWYSCELSHNSITSVDTSYSYKSTGYDFYNFSPPLELEEGDVVTVKMAVKPSNATQNSDYFDYLDKMAEGIVLKIKSIKKVEHNTPSGRITEVTQLTFDDNAIDMHGYSEIMVRYISVEKLMPDFVDICSFENRMWGVTKDELRCSMLGDASEWNDYSVDDYGTLPSSCFCTPVETDGDFTAITAYNGSILAFKEDCIHRLYGSQPSEYTVNKITCPGVAKDCKKTLTHVAGSLYYMGRCGIYRYNGSNVSLISRNLDLSGAKALCAGGDERYYHIAFKKDGACLVYVYDTLYGIWNIMTSPEDICEFVLTDTGLQPIGKNHIYSYGDNENISWSFVYSFGAKEFTSKHLCSVSLRFYLEKGGNISVTYKSRIKEKTVLARQGQNREEIVTINLPPYLSEDYELHFSGKGSFTLISFTVNYKETSIN